MKIKKFSNKPSDINERIGSKPVVCYPNNNFEEKNLNILHLARKNLNKKKEIKIIIIPSNKSKEIHIPANSSITTKLGSSFLNSPFNEIKLINRIGINNMNLTR